MKVNNILSASLLIFVLIHSMVLKAGSFESSGMGARILGMGGAFTGVANDVNAIYFNPAGLVNIIYKQISFMYYDMYGESLISNTFLGIAIPYVGPGSLGIGWSRTGISDDKILSGFSENIVTTAYGLKIIDKFSIGISFKFLGAYYGRMRGLGYSFDTGMYYQWRELISLGLIYQDFSKPEIRWDTDFKENMSSNLRMGLGITPLNFLLVSLDVDQINNDRKNIHLGLEMIPFDSKVLALRTGLFKIGNENLGYSFGFGLKIRTFHIDYAMNIHSGLGSSNVFGGSFEF